MAPHRIRAAAFLGLLALVACATPQTQAPTNGKKDAAPPEPIRITIVATNDIHGWVYPRKYSLKDGKEASEGGMPAFSGYVSVLRKQNPGGVVLVDAGDMFQGTLTSNLTEGAVVISAMNRLGYTAAAIGNHEFDYGPVGPAPVALKPDQDPFGALKARISEAKFPVLAANISEVGTGQRPSWLSSDGTLLVEVKGIKVGIVGLTTPSTPTVTNPVNVQTLRFAALAPEAQAAAKSLRDRGAEIVMAVAHAGGKCAQWLDPKDLSTCDLDNGEIFEMLGGLPPKTLDVVVAGHTHAPLAHVVNGTPVVETWGLGRYFSTIDLAVDPVKRRVIEDQTKITGVIPICERVDPESGSCDPKNVKDKADGKLVAPTFRGAAVVVDAEMQKLIDPALAQVEELQNRPIGVQAPQKLMRSYESESPLGGVLADALRERERADIALLNPGGLRADIKAGDLKYGDIYEVLPFDNTVATVTVTGDELRRLLNAAFGSRKGVFQVSGLRIQLAKCPGQARLKSYTQDTGKAFQADRKYKVVMPDFLARGGDGLGPVMSSLQPGAIDLGLERDENFRDALVSFWQSKKGGVLVAPKPGRVQFVDDGSTCNPGAALDLHVSPQ